MSEFPQPTELPTEQLPFSLTPQANVATEQEARVLEDATVGVLGQGYHNACFLVTRTGEENLVAKTALAANTQATLRMEYAVLSHLHAQGEQLPPSMAPRPHSFIGDTSARPMMLLMEHIEGAPITLEEFRQLPDEDVDRLAKILSALHAKNYPFFTSPGNPHPRDGTHAEAFWDMVRSTVDDPLTKLPRDFQPEVQQLVRQVRECLDAEFKKRADHFRGNDFRLTHGDFGPHNMLRRPDGTITCIDWEGARIGDAARELSYMAVNHELPDSLFDHFLNRYMQYMPPSDDSLLKRIELYGWANRLDDMVWALGKYQQDESCKEAYEVRLRQLQDFLHRQ